MSPPAADALRPSDPERVTRFRNDVAGLIALAWERGRLPVERTLALAVSGGADSMAMLILAHAAFPGEVTAATVDHGLRPEAAAEAALVASVCERLGVPHRTLAPGAPIQGGSVQKQAREARYPVLSRWAREVGAYHLLTAHHADDQAETLLMRLNRGSGPAGLSGIRPYRFEGMCAILRPLLHWRRDELRRIVEQAGALWVEDPSNEDPRHDRTHYRAFLAGQDFLDPAALAAAAAHIGEAEEVLETFTGRYWLDRWRNEIPALRAGDLPREIQRRLARRAIAEIRTVHDIVQPPFSSAANIEALLDALELGQRATQAGVMVTPHGDDWHFARVPPRRSL